MLSKSERDHIRKGFEEWGQELDMAEYLLPLLDTCDELERRAERDEQVYFKQSAEVDQILGKALGYPWYKDDPANWPNATEADGVCTGDHVPESLAAEIAARFAECKRLREALEAGKGE